MQGKGKRNILLRLIPRTWRRSRPAVPRTRSLATSCTMKPLVNLPRCHSLPDATLSSDSDWDDMGAGTVAPAGYFAVYVGPDRARFVIKTESVNQPVFRMLLKEAEREYGFDFSGPLTLPCEVAVFRNILSCLNGDLEDSLHGEDAHMRLLGHMSPFILSV